VPQGDAYSDLSTMANPVGGGVQTGLSGQFRQKNQAQDQGQFIAFPLSSRRSSRLLNEALSKATTGQVTPSTVAGGFHVVHAEVSL